MTADGNSGRLARRLVQYSWLALLAWQITWHGLLPLPLGSRSWLLALLAAAPLALLTRGVWQARHRSYFWAMFLVMLYFMAGVTEAWSNADQRAAAMLQVFLALGFFGGLVISWRTPK